VSSKMGMQDIRKEYEQIKADLKKKAEEELEIIDEKINALEIEAEKVGKEAEAEINNNSKILKEAR